MNQHGLAKQFIRQPRDSGAESEIRRTGSNMKDEFAVISSTTGNLKLAYQSFGDEKAPVFLLITGWFSDLTLWPRGLCKLLADQGYRVIRYDNRDSGLSTRTSMETVDLSRPPYSMSDLASDAVGLLDALEIQAAHMVGIAMGGTIAQFVAIEHQERVLSLTLVPAGSREYLPPDPSIVPLLEAPMPREPEALARHHKSSLLPWLVLHLMRLIMRRDKRNQ